MKNIWKYLKLGIAFSVATSVFYWVSSYILRFITGTAITSGNLLDTTKGALEATGIILVMMLALAVLSLLFAGYLILKLPKKLKIK